MAQTDKAKNLLKRFDRLKSQRQNWESHWQEVADYMQPRKADVTKPRSKGDKRTELIFDSSPLQAVELLGASLHGMLTNPSTPWSARSCRAERPARPALPRRWFCRLRRCRSRR